MTTVHSIEPEGSPRQQHVNSIKTNTGERPSILLNGHGISFRVFNGVKPILLQST